MAKLLTAHADVGGDIVSAGGTGTYAVNTWATEIQAGSYALMDTAYGALGTCRSGRRSPSSARSSRPPRRRRASPAGRSPTSG